MLSIHRVSSTKCSCAIDFLCGNQPADIALANDDLIFILTPCLGLLCWLFLGLLGIFGCSWGLRLLNLLRLGRRCFGLLSFFDLRGGWLRRLLLLGFLNRGRLFLGLFWLLLLLSNRGRSFLFLFLWLLLSLFFHFLIIGLLDGLSLSGSWCFFSLLLQDLAGGGHLLSRLRFGHSRSCLNGLRSHLGIFLDR